MEFSPEMVKTTPRESPSEVPYSEPLLFASLLKRSSPMSQASGAGAPPPDGAPPPNQEGADDKDEKKELDGTGAGSQMGGASGAEGGGTSAGGEGTSSGKKKDKKGKKGKKKKTAHFKKRGHPCYKVLCIVFSLLSLASLATALTMGALMLNDTASK